MFIDPDFIRQKIYQKLDLKDTNELIEIWKANGCNVWSDDALCMIKEILQRRNVDIPKQYPRGNIKRIKIKSLRPKDSPHYSLNWDSFYFLFGGIGVAILGYGLNYYADYLIQTGVCTDPVCAPGAIGGAALICLIMAIYFSAKFLSVLFIKKDPKEVKIPKIEVCLDELAELIHYMKYLNYGKRRFFRRVKKFVMNEAICSSCSNRFILGKALLVLEGNKDVTYLFTCPMCGKTSAIHKR